MQKVKRAYSMNAVWAVEVFDARPIVQPQQLRMMLPFGIFIRHPGIDRNRIVMTALYHEGPRGHQVGHVAVVERIAEVELGHLVLRREAVGERLIGSRHLPYPFVEVS